MRVGAGAASMHDVRAIDFLDAGGGVMPGTYTLYAITPHWTVNEGGRSLTISKEVIEARSGLGNPVPSWIGGSGRYLRLYLHGHGVTATSDLFVDTPVITTEE